jgi:hypothetical protein
LTEEIVLVNFYNLHYKCEVAKLGTAATWNFLSGKREKEYFRGAKKAETPNLLNL